MNTLTSTLKTNQMLYLSAMKRTLLFLLFSSLAASAQIVNIPDYQFKTALRNGLCVDTNNDGTPDTSADLNNDDEIQVSEAEAVQNLYILAQYNVSDMTGIEAFVNLRVLYCEYLSLTSLDVSMMPNLRWLRATSNDLTTLNLGTISAIEKLEVSGNALTSLDISHLSNLKVLSCAGNPVGTLDLSVCTQLEELYCGSNALNTLDLSTVPLLKKLYCNENNLSSLSFANNTLLEELSCSSNDMTTLNVSGLTNLKKLTAESCPLNGLDITGLTQLTQVACNFNQFQSFSHGNNSALTSLQIAGYPGNIGGVLDLSDIPTLKTLTCNSQGLTGLNLTGLQLTSLQFSGNQITTIDVSGMPGLTSIVGNNNNLQSMFIKNGAVSSDQYLFSFYGNPNLHYICCDEGELSVIQSKLNTSQYAGMTNVTYNTYCSFVPGGTFYSIDGVARFDDTNNGCSDTDPLFSHMRMKIAAGAVNSFLVGDDSGHYGMDLQAGTYTITPQPENPSYFTVTPTSATITLPAATNPITQAFCVKANGSHPDVEVSIVPENRARPGFVTRYEIVLRNKGNKTTSGAVTFDFPEDYVTPTFSNPLPDTDSSTAYSWTYNDLLPYEIRTYHVWCLLNTPLDPGFPLESGDVLSYTATGNSQYTDDTPSDNTFIFNHHVVNANDPNDKTCLEGDTLVPEKIGDYVHYVIRFENVGTAEAENVVVKDVIDTLKFDISTLVPLTASHPFVTKIRDTNTVEFIFENIMLPFDDANNDGYVSFKIKTKPTLVLGNTFSNTASIYFDFNAAVVTNTALTTVANLGAPSFVDSKLTVWPNPVHDRLNVTAAQPVEFLEVTDLSGRSLRSVAHSDTISVNGLSTGVYVLTATSGGQATSRKVVVE